MNSNNLSPLRYPGSKRKLLLYFDQILKCNKLDPDIIIEPFVGGASVSLYFLSKNIVKRAIMSDKDELIYAFWHTSFTNPNYLIDFVKKIKVNLYNFYKYKKISRDTKKYSEKKLAEACLFLNRTSFSGMLRSEIGPIGGKEQNSQYAINCRFNKKLLIQKFKIISSFKKQVIVLPYDWKKTIRYSNNWIKKNKEFNKPLFYFDPPFYYKADKLYRYYFREEEHKNLKKAILSLKYDWVLSYDYNRKIKEIYSEYKNNNIHIKMPYSINSHATKLKKELIITPLRLPKFTKSKGKIIES